MKKKKLQINIVKKKQLTSAFIPMYFDRKH